MAEVTRFTIEVSDEVIRDLKARIRRTRWPGEAPGDAWAQGTDLSYLRAFLTYWADEFDWPARQRQLNELGQFETSVDGVRIHFVHEKARSGGVPLLLIHGWPSCFIEYTAALPLLVEPAKHSIDGPAFDVVVPSLPGYGFSHRPPHSGVNYEVVAGLFVQLMERLGYERWGVGGGDFGAGVAAHMARLVPDRLTGLHLTTVEIGPDDRGAVEWSPAEEAFLAGRAGWAAQERGYWSIQSTKPQTLGYGLTDSPAGLAAWLLEKWRSWTDSRGDPAGRLSAEFLATLVTIYWVTGSITTSMRDYYDNRWHGVALPAEARVDVPTAIALFGHHFVPEPLPPRRWVERLYDVQRWTVMPAGGHFGPAEEPDLFARDVAAAFRQFGGE